MQYHVKLPTHPYVLIAYKGQFSSKNIRQIHEYAYILDRELTHSTTGIVMVPKSECGIRYEVVKEGENSMFDLDPFKGPRIRGRIDTTLTSADVPKKQASPFELLLIVETCIGLVNNLYPCLDRYWIKSDVDVYTSQIHLTATTVMPGEPLTATIDVAGLTTENFDPIRVRDILIEFAEQIKCRDAKNPWEHLVDEVD